MRTPRLADPDAPARRGFFARAAALLVAPWCFAPFARAQDATSIETIVPAIRDFTKGAQVRKGKVKLDLPRLADNGNSVALKISVQSPMSQADFVRSVGLFSEKNPRPVIARFYFGPRAGKAEIASRIRLAGTQRVIAVAELSDGSFWSDTATVDVTLSACLDAS
jgi:sulfur-oxidizing protein SoxY